MRVFTQALLAVIFVAQAPAIASESGQSKQSIVQSNWDYRFGAGARSLPFGAALSAELGRGILLWGDGPSPAGEFRYGYVRPLARIASSGMTTRAEAAIGVYPISFFGIEGGGALGQRFTHHLATIDCGMAVCDGALEGAYVRPKITLGYGPWVLVASAEWQRLVSLSAQANQAFADEGTDLVAAPGGDTLQEFNAFAGWRGLPHWTFGIAASSDQMLGSGDWNNLGALMVSRALGDWSFTGGAGYYQSALTVRSFTAFARVEFSPVTGLRLR